MTPSSVGSPQERYARAVLTRYMKVRPGENVTIEGWTHALPWASALAKEARRLKAFPLVLHEDEGDFWEAVDAKHEGIYGAAPTHEWAALAKTDVYLHMWGPGDRARLLALGPRAEAIFAWNDSWYKTATKAGVRGARLEIGRPGALNAKLYGVDEKAWTERIVRASEVDPQSMRRAAAPIVKALERGRRVRVHDDHGTDVTLGLTRAKCVVNTGDPTPAERRLPFAILSNLPAGSITLALDSSVADGTVVANRGSYTDGGKATGGVFEFERGKLVRQKYQRGWDLFEGSYTKAGKGRDRPGQLRVGLNPALRDTPQVEDLEAGAITISVGMNSFLPGGKNKAQYFGFVVVAGAELEVDGRPVRLPRSR